jgi:hypothetical protein
MQFKTKSQVLAEFLMLFGVTVLIFLLLTAVIMSELTSSVEETESLALFRLATQVQSEFAIASTMLEGFSHTINLPPSINDKTYDARIISSYVYISQDGQDVILPLPAIIGNVTSKTYFVSKDANGLTVQ